MTKVREIQNLVMKHTHSLKSKAKSLVADDIYKEFMSFYKYNIASINTTDNDPNLDCIIHFSLFKILIKYNVLIEGYKCKAQPLLDDVIKLMGLNKDILHNLALLGDALNPTLLQKLLLNPDFINAFSLLKCNIHIEINHPILDLPSSILADIGKAIMTLYAIGRLNVNNFNLIYNNPHGMLRCQAIQNADNEVLKDGLLDYILTPTYASLLPIIANSSDVEELLDLFDKLHGRDLLTEKIISTLLQVERQYRNSLTEAKNIWKMLENKENAAVFLNCLGALSKAGLSTPENCLRVLSHSHPEKLFAPLQLLKFEEFRQLDFENLLSVPEPSHYLDAIRYLQTSRVLNPGNRQLIMRSQNMREMASVLVNSLYADIHPPYQKYFLEHNNPSKFAEHLRYIVDANVKLDETIVAAMATSNVPSVLKTCIARLNNAMKLSDNMKDLFAAKDPEKFATDIIRAPFKKGIFSIFQPAKEESKETPLQPSQGAQKLIRCESQNSF